MDKIEWCKKKQRGIRLIEPNRHIANDYLRKSDDSISVMLLVKMEEWKIISAYYACYDALYALLQRAGVKSEIRECSIALMEFFGFSENEIEFLKALKRKRINAQYYVNRKAKLGEMNKIRDFVLKCKKLIHSSDFDEIRKKIEKKLGEPV